MIKENGISNRILRPYHKRLKNHETLANSQELVLKRSVDLTNMMPKFNFEGLDLIIHLENRIAIQFS